MPTVPFYSLQITRALAAWMVVYHHYLQLYHQFQADHALTRFLALRGNFGVDIFFVLSGFVMYLTCRKADVTAGGFYIKRLTRVLPAYWFYSAAMVMLLLLLPQLFSFTGYTSETLWRSLLLVPHENPSGIGLFPLLTVGWTLMYEMTFYTLLALCLLISRQHAVALCVVVIVALHYLFPQGQTYSPLFDDYVLWQFLFGFAIGRWVLGEHFRRWSLRIRPARWATGLLLLGTLLVSEYVKFGIFQRTLAATLIVLAFIVAEPLLNRNNPWIAGLIRLGDYSYSTYLCHVPLIGLFLYATGSAVDGWREMLLLLVLSLSIALCSWGSYRLVENGRPVRWLRHQLLQRLAVRATTPGGS